MRRIYLMHNSTVSTVSQLEALNTQVPPLPFGLRPLQRVYRFAVMTKGTARQLVKYTVA